MLIILEGVDGAGKSTLASRITSEISRRYPDSHVEYIHASQLLTDTYEAYCNPLEDYQPGKNRHIVIDRWHVGEQIYGPLYRKASKFTDATYRWTEMFLASKGATLWNVTQELDILKSRLSERGEDFLQDNHVDFVRKEFIKHTEKSMLFSNKVSPNEDNVDDFATFIVDDGEYAERRATRFSKLKIDYLGATYSDPRTVLIIPNKKSIKGFDPRTSEEARVLLEAIPSDLIGSLGILQTSSVKKIEKFVDEFPFTAVIAYDSSIVKKLDEVEIYHQVIDKPTVESGILYSRHLNVQIEKAGEVENIGTSDQD